MRTLLDHPLRPVDEHAVDLDDLLAVLVFEQVDREPPSTPEHAALVDVTRAGKDLRIVTTDGRERAVPVVGDVRDHETSRRCDRRSSPRAFFLPLSRRGQSP
jgi:hypothetical protein